MPLSKCSRSARHCLVLVVLLLPWIPVRAVNVVFILADDLGYGELGSYGQEKIRTPHLDRLAREGMRFTQHYTGQPVCAPARCTLMTGKHSGHAEIKGNRPARLSFPEFTEGQHPLSAAAVTLPMVLQKAGYATGAMGKWGLGPVGSTGDPNKKGFDLFFGYNCQSLAHSFYPEYLWKNDVRVPLNANPIPGRAKQPEGPVTMAPWIGEHYAPDSILAEGLRFIDQQKHRPFFLYLAFIEPHAAIHPPADRVNQYPESWDTEAYRGQAGYLPHPRPRAAYAAMISDLDRYVGEVRTALEKAGVLDDTLIVFTSDNGTTHGGRGNTHFHVAGVDPPFFNSTAGLRGYKGSVYEGGIRIPAIASWPGRIPAGSTTAVPSYFPDWFPTLCAAAGVEPPPGLDGVNLLPVLTGARKEDEERPPLVWVFPDYGGQIAVRLGTFKVVRTGIKSKGGPGPWEVYNLATDPVEAINIAEARPDLVLTARQILRDQWVGMPDFPLAKDLALQ
jgi:arylsulfatase A-like enzyme